MVITRTYNDATINITLTDQEILDTYKEQQNIYDRTDIVAHIPEYLTENERMSLAMAGNNMKRFINNAAAKMRENIDIHNMEPNTAMKNAFTATKHQFLTENS